MTTKSAAYGWIIDTDHAPDPTAPEGTNANAKGVMGPGNISDNILNHLLQGGGRQFRMKDADGELCYSGRIITPEDEIGGDMDFAPLRFGTRNAGATEIWYWNGRTWDEL